MCLDIIEGKNLQRSHITLQVWIICRVVLFRVCLFACLLLYGVAILLIYHLYFQYLGCTEVFDSRGMQVCEDAVKALKTVSFILQLK